MIAVGTRVVLNAAIGGKSSPWNDTGVVVGHRDGYVLFLPDHHRDLGARPCSRGCTLTGGGRDGVGGWLESSLTPIDDYVLEGVTYDPQPFGL